jgi:polyisoprenoid-binding protein YceI
LAISAIVVVQLLRADDPGLLTRPPELTPGEELDGIGDEDVLRFVIDAASSVKYIVREKLTALPVSTNAVGETTAITGEIYLTTAGLVEEPASILRVDLRTLRSDESMRDAYLRMTTLRTAQYPFAELRITAIEGFPVPYTDGSEVDLKLTGDLTIRDVTRPLSFTVKARRLGDSLSAIADADFKMSEFGIQPPDVAVAKAEDSVHLQIVIVAKLQRE